MVFMNFKQTDFLTVYPYDLIINSAIRTPKENVEIILNFLDK